MSFFSAQNWFYPISERFGGIFGNFSNFSFFFEIFPSFLVWKIGEKNVIFLVPIIGFTQFLNDLGAFSKVLKFGPFLAIFKVFHFLLKFFQVFRSEKRRQKIL